MVACVVLLVAVLFNASPAVAATLEPCSATPPPGPVTEIDGEATIVQGPAIRRKLNRAGLKVRLIQPANSFTGRPQFPVTETDHQSRVSRVRLGGGIRLIVGKRRELRLKRMLVVVRKSGPSYVYARTGGNEQRFLEIRGAGIRRDTANGELTLTGGNARLTPAAAKRIRARFKIDKRALGNSAAWGRFDLYSLYKVTVPPEDPEAEAPPVPPVVAKPAGATDLVSATISWRVRDSFVRYVSSGDGVKAIDGAIPGPAESLSGAPPLVYSFGFPFASGWTDSATDTALIEGSGGVAFRYCRHTVNFHVNNPEIELNGADSRMIFRVNGLDGTAFPNQRAVVVDLDLTQADVSTSGKTTTWENIPGFVPQGSAGVFADFYFGGDSFGELDLSVTTP